MKVAGLISAAISAANSVIQQGSFLQVAPGGLRVPVIRVYCKSLWTKASAKCINVNVIFVNPSFSGTYA